MSKTILEVILAEIPFKNGIMSKLEVYEGISQIGYGYIIQYLDDGSISEPTLFRMDGTPLPEGWYGLRITEDRRAVIVPKRNQ